MHGDSDYQCDHIDNLVQFLSKLNPIHMLIDNQHLPTMNDMLSDKIRQICQRAHKYGADRYIFKQDHSYSLSTILVMQQPFDVSIFAENLRQYITDLIDDLMPFDVTIHQHNQPRAQIKCAYRSSFDDTAPHYQHIPDLITITVIDYIYQRVDNIHYDL